jgi:L-rhamnose mutarotase
MARYCLTLDLKDDEKLIEQYKKHHEEIWPEVRESILSSGITDMNIYLLGNRLFMIMDVNASFSFEAKAVADAANPKIQEWEALMWHYQAPLPQAKPNEKWILMEQIFALNPNTEHLLSN